MNDVREPKRQRQGGNSGRIPFLLVVVVVIVGIFIIVVIVIVVIINIVVALWSGTNKN